jgi:ATP-dependent Clp endopeptidase proteolytic subunit ClpP
MALPKMLIRKPPSKPSFLKTKSQDESNSPPQIELPEEFVKSANEQPSRPSDSSPMDELTLQSMGIFMLFEEVMPESAYDLSEFIIKANCVFEETQPLTIFVNTPGGSVYSGLGIVDLMESSRLPIQTVAIGAVASMGSIIFTSGTPGMRVMSRNAYIMTHQFMTGMEGRYHEFLAQRSHDDHMHEKFIAHYVRTSKMSRKQVKDILLGPSDKWLDAKESLKYGLCDVIKNPWE